MTRTALLLLLSALFPCCTGGGGGGAAPLEPPNLVSTVWIGTGAAPASGDFLELFFSLDVELVAGKLLDSSDLLLSSGSLGTITSPPVLVNARLVRLTLGSGVSFTAGTTTVDLRSTNDTVKGTSGKLGTASTARTITHGDNLRPSITRLSLDDIEAQLNGTGPAGGTLQVPQNGFTIDVRHTDNAAVDPAKTVVFASVTVGTGGGNKAAGQNLASDLTLTATAALSSFLVPAAVTFPEGAVTLTAYVTDTSGLVAGPVSFAFTVKASSDAMRPLENGQLWYLDFTRDVESYSVNLSVVQPLVVTTGANTVPDFDDLLLALGVYSSTPITNLSGTKNSNEYVFDLIKVRLLLELGVLYAGANVSFTFTSPGTFPTGNGGSVAYASLGFSQICIAGAESAAGDSGVLGKALFDPNNTTQDNDCLLDFAGSERLGVFLHTMANFGIRDASSSAFRVTFDPLMPARSGVPIGNDAQDGPRLLGTLNDGRATTIVNAITRLSRFAAVVAAHEMGHSLGLVKDGAMPNGLYGGDSVNFPGSSAGHIRLPSSVFPSGVNVMSPSLSFETALVPATAFESLSLAYLRERALVNH